MGGPGLAGPEGFDVADGLGGGPPDGAGVVAPQVDGDRGVGDVDGDDPSGVDAPEGDLPDTEEVTGSIPVPPTSSSMYIRIHTRCSG
jgi:hypothetical protein